MDEFNNERKRTENETMDFDEEAAEHLHERIPF